MYSLKQKDTVTIPQWKAGTPYKANENLVIYDSTIYICIETHTSSSDFDNTKWQIANGSTQIPNWVADTHYAINALVINNNKIYQCNTDNTDSTFTESHWNLISGGGGSGGDIVEDWKSNTVYKKNRLVNVDSVLYLCLIEHTSSNDFNIDVSEGKWQKIGSGSDSSLGYSQITQYDASANYVVKIPITYDINNCRPPVEILKHADGSTVTETELDFNLAEKSYFESNDNVVFDGTMHEKTEYSYNMSVEEVVADTDDDGNTINQYISVTDDYIDLADYSAVSDVEVE